MQRVLTQRSVAERRLRDHREDARFQLARANVWLKKVRRLPQHRPPARRLPRPRPTGRRGPLNAAL